MSDPAPNLDGLRVALVTGASRGIGAAIAGRLIADDWFVVGTATSDAGVAAIDDALGARGAGIVLDVSDASAVAEQTKALTSAYGAPQALVNNAGIAEDDLLIRTDEESLGRVLNTNLASAIRLSKAVMRGMMKARWGRIVNLSSVVARMGNGGQSVYAATKAGVEGFTRSLAQEVGSRNITVNAVAPGFIATDMTAAMSDEQRAALLTQIPLARLGEPADVADLVAFLVSDAASYITGETIQINGGMHFA